MHSHKTTSDKIIDLDLFKQRSINNQRLEMIMRDSLDNIEDYSFQMYYASNMDMIDEYQILPCFEQPKINNFQARA
jgi:hypothetical protein